LPVLYAESVPTAEKCFLATVDRLAERDLLEITFVIYTSDHGEALGEAANAATLGHGDQITPDLVDVSVVFGIGLPDVDLDALLSGIDVAPTALAALGRSGHRENGDTVD
jgi:arylsulfatase A-like enzyme